jgi:hypothetical protein
MLRALPRGKINFNANGEGLLCIPGIAAGFTKNWSSGWSVRKNSALISREGFSGLSWMISMEN